MQTFSPDPNGVNGRCLPDTETGHFLIDPTNIVCSVGPPVGMSDPDLTPGGVPLFTFGNMGRNVLRGPGINNWDISSEKDFKLAENKSVELRSEFFNTFNHAQFYSPTFRKRRARIRRPVWPGNGRHFVIYIIVLSWAARDSVRFKVLFLKYGVLKFGAIRFRREKSGASWCLGLAERRITHAEPRAHVF